MQISRTSTTFLFSMLLLTSNSALRAQAPFQGNGQGQAFIQHSVARIGASLDITFGSPASPCGFAVLAVSTGVGPTPVPGLGLVGLDLLAPEFELRYFFLTAAGVTSLSMPIPNLPFKALEAPLFVIAGVLEPSGISLSRTTRVQWQNPDAWAPAGELQVARAGHTATALGRDATDNESRVLVTGGGGGSILVPQASTAVELWSPALHSTSPGPSLRVARALHQAVRLRNGRVLLCGGTDSGGNVTATVEIYDPVTNTMVDGPAMRRPRAGHAATLLGNGKVLVTGGVATYVDPLANLAAVLNTAQDTGELFDPTAGTWTLVPGAMAQKRSGHSQTLIANGRVLISGGIQGGVTTPQGFDLPLYTATCNVYDPATNAFLATGSMQVGRAFHGASVLGNGQVLVTGGIVTNQSFGIVGATNACELWNGSTFATTASLQTPAGAHVQFTGSDGRAVIVGGLTGIFPALGGTAATGRHDGVAFTPGRSIGENPADTTLPPLPRGAMTATQICDGSWVLLGGSDGAVPLRDALVFLP